MANVSSHASKGVGLIALAMTVLVVNWAGAQRRPAPCPRCEIRARQVAQFDVPVGLLSDFNWPGAIAATASRVYVSIPMGLNVIAFDHSGRVLNTTNLVGVGERRAQVYALTVLQDTLFVGGIDTRGPFVTSMAPDGSRVTRHDVIGLPRAFAALPAGTLVINAQVPSRERAGFALHASTSGHDEVRSFKLIPPDENPLLCVTSAAAGGVWIVPAVPPGGGEIAIERWSVAGRRLQAFSTTAEWLETPVGPPGALLDIRDDGNGLLWVLGRVQRADWRLGAAREHGETAYKDKQYDLLYDSMVEVYDARTGVRLARQRVPVYGVALGPNGQLLALRRTSDNRLRILIWQLGFSSR